MDSLFDTMPYLYDMIEDDLRNATSFNCCSNMQVQSIHTDLQQQQQQQQNISNCSDDEPLSLSNCSNIYFDELCFALSPPSTLNSSLNLSSSSSPTSTGTSSSAASPLSNSFINSFSCIPTSLYDDINSYTSSNYSSSQQQHQQIQDSSSTTTKTTTATPSYEIINPLFLTESNSNDAHKSQQLYINSINNDNSNQMQPTSYKHAPAVMTASTATLLSTRPLKTQSVTQSTQNAKRCKNTSSDDTYTQQQQQVYVFNSDGENSSQLSDGSSNSSSEGSTHNCKQSNTISTVKTHFYTPPATPQTIHLIQQTGESTPNQQQQQQQSSANTTILGSNLSKNNQLSIIKLTKSNDSSSNPSNNHHNNTETKQVIQYKTALLNKTTPSFLNVTKSVVTGNTSDIKSTLASTTATTGKVFPKPPFSYSCLIAMALRNSDSGTLPVSDIYEFIIENFPYYKTARDGWKNSIRHNLSLNKCFEKIENPTNGSKKGCLWALNPDKCKKLEEECKRCRQRDLVNIRLSMSRPDDLNKIERGEQRLKKHHIQQHHQQQQRKILDSHSTNIYKACSLQSAANSSSSLLVNLVEEKPSIHELNQLNHIINNNDSLLLNWSTNNTNKNENLKHFIKTEAIDDCFSFLDNSNGNYVSLLTETAQ